MFIESRFAILTFSNYGMVENSQENVYNNSKVECSKLFAKFNKILQNFKESALTFGNRTFLSYGV